MASNRRSNVEEAFELVLGDSGRNIAKAKWILMTLLSIEDDEGEEGDVDMPDKNNTDPNISAHFYCKQCGKQCVLFV